MASLRGRVAAMECCLCESPCPTPRNDRRADADEGGAAPVSPSTGRRTRRLDGFYSLEKTAKALQAADLRQLTEARLCGAPGRSQRRAVLQQMFNGTDCCVTHLAWLRQKWHRTVAACQKVAPADGARSENKSNVIARIGVLLNDGRRLIADTPVARPLEALWVLRCCCGAGVVDRPQRRRCHCGDTIAAPNEWRAKRGAKLVPPFS